MFHMTDWTILKCRGKIEGGGDILLIRNKLWVSSRVELLF